MAVLDGAGFGCLMYDESPGFVRLSRSVLVARVYGMVLSLRQGFGKGSSVIVRHYTTEYEIE